MSYADAEGVKLYVEETGTGYPIIFVHEFAGDYRSWRPQVQFFSRRYRTIAYNARGYPPSDVPADTIATTPRSWGRLRRTKTTRACASSSYVVRG